MTAAVSVGAAVSGVELDLENFTTIRFGQDKRIEEVARMLCSSTIPPIKMIERPEIKFVFQFSIIADINLLY
jgi:anaphase-promoting complex subunit 1